MNQNHDVAAELESLQSELQSSKRVRRDCGGDMSRPAVKKISIELGHMLDELRSAFDEAAKSGAAEAEDVVTSHPLVSIASAFLLGVIVGRLVGRT